MDGSRTQASGASQPRGGGVVRALNRDNRYRRCQPATSQSRSLSRALSFLKLILLHSVSQGFS